MDQVHVHRFITCSVYSVLVWSISGFVSLLGALWYVVFRFRSSLRSVSGCWLGLAWGRHSPAVAVDEASQRGPAVHQDVGFGDQTKVVVWFVVIFMSSTCEIKSFGIQTSIVFVTQHNRTR